MDPGEQPVTGAAQRRNRRRLRSRWLHEQQSIAAALATSLHHSSRGQKKARAGAEESEIELHGHGPEDSSSPAGALQSCTKKSPAEGGLPAWQSRRGHRNGFRSALWTHAGDVCACPVSRRSCGAEDQLVEVVRLFDTMVPEQVIDVSKITSQDVIPQRAVLRVPQMAEQLVRFTQSCPRTCVLVMFHGSNLRRGPHGCLRRWNLRGEAEEGATIPFVVATRTDVDRRGAGYGVPPLVPKGGHQERRPKGPEDSHQHQGGTCRVLRTFLGR